jgi:hypothetical protein
LHKTPRNGEEKGVVDNEGIVQLHPCGNGMNKSEDTAIRKFTVGMQIN